MVLICTTWCVSPKTGVRLKRFEYSNFIAVYCLGWRKLCPGTGVNGREVSGNFTYKWLGDQCFCFQRSCRG